MLKVWKDFSQLPYTVDLSSFVIPLGGMGLTYTKVFSNDGIQRIPLVPQLQSVISSSLSPTSATINHNPYMVEVEGHLVQVTFYGCSTPAVTDTYSPTNLDLKEFSTVEFNLTLYDCFYQQIDAIPELVFRLQKN